MAIPRDTAKMLWLANGQLTAMVNEQEKHIDDMSTVMLQLMKNTKDLETLCKVQQSFIDELKDSNAHLQAENNYILDSTPEKGLKCPLGYS